LTAKNAKRRFTYQSVNRLSTTNTAWNFEP